MGGKTATSTQAVSIPPSVLAQYQSVNAQAGQTAQTPFQQYGTAGATNPDGTPQQFVAPVNAQQQTGISGVNAGASEAQPYFGAATGELGQTQAGTTPINNAATGLAAQSAESVDPSNLDAASINKYLSPYLGDVLGSESALLNQNNQQQQSGALGTAISSGAFGGDRTGIAAANLEQQQNLANANIYSNILNTGYGQALGTAQQQQGVGLAAGQANRAALASAGSELSGIGATTYGEGASTATTLAGLGTGAQTAALTGAQAQIGAGTVEQQTQQAQDTAEYNQFLQQQSYPFQVDQFLANIAEGTGALSGSTTTTQQPGGFFSDRRLKHDIRKIGKTYDGQAIYSYKMHGDERTHVGLIAQEVEKKHPRAVGVASGYKFVDYGQATEKAANRGHFHEGGGVSGGGRVWHPAAYAVGGSPSIVDPSDMAAILQAQRSNYAPHSNGTGVYGSSGGLPHGGAAAVPAPSGAVAHLVTANGGIKARPSGASNVVSIMNAGRSASKLYDQIEKDNASPPSGTADPDMSRGGVATRAHFDSGGSADGGLDAVLQAQRNMYAPQNQNRSIPAQGSGNHQLAVASGSPTPAPSGASNVNTSIGLAQKGYQAYKHFNPSTTPKSGNSGAPTSGDISSSTTGSTTGTNSLSGVGVDAGAAPTMPPIEGADAGAAADTAAPAASGAASGVAAPAAAEVAAPAAAEVAAPAAADAAGTVVAGGAVDAGAADAGAADAAAALATEYAAADAAVVAAAARRGGRIRGKFDAGGTPYEATPSGNPYSDDSGQIVIPDTENSSKLQTAGALKKQPTGLQTLETLGTQEGAQGAMSGMFSNSALARGGGVAARRKGYDAGGSPDDDPTAQDVPLPDSSISGGVAAPAPAAEAAPAGEKKTWWDKIKGSELAKPNNLVPLLTAIGAMGSAPTRSFGTALATGIGAGAQSYVPTQEGLAQTGEIQARTKGINIENQMKALKYQWASEPDAPIEAPSSGSASDKAQSVDQQYRKKYFVQQGYMPSEETAMQQAIKKSSVLGSMPVDRVKQAHDNRVTMQTTTNQNAAQGEADDLYTTATQDPNKVTRQAALVKYNALHQWTADKYENQAGLIRNSRTGQPPIGIAAQSLTPEQAFNNWRTRVSPTDYGAQQKIPFEQYAKENGINIPPDWKAPGTTPDAAAAAPPPAAAAPRPAAPAAAPPVPAARPAAQSQLIDDLKNPATANAFATPTPGSPAVRAAPPAAAAPAQQQPIDFKDVPTKPGWADNARFVVPEAMKDEVNKYGAVKNELINESGGLRQTQQQMVTTQRMLNEMPNAKFGPGSGGLATFQTVLGNLTGSQFTNWVDSNPAARQILEKQMGTTALDTTLSKLRSEGAQVRLGQGESNLILNKLSASPEMSKAAIQSLLGWQKQQLEYEADRQNSIPKYLQSNGDPRYFDNWYSNKRPLGGAVSTGAPAGTTLGKPMPDTDKLQAYADTHFQGDTRKATQFLKSKGYGR